jgi:hypothetical protein
VQSAECRDGTEYLQYLTVGGAELQALSAHATYHNVNFVQLLRTSDTIRPTD